MALIKCTECGKEISDKAQACVNCGAPISAPLAGSDTETPQTSKDKKSDFNTEITAKDYSLSRFVVIFPILFCIMTLVLMATIDPNGVPALGKVFFPVAIIGFWIAAFYIWKNSFFQEDKTKYRRVFALNDFFTVPTSRDKKRQNIIIFSIGVFFAFSSVSMLITAREENIARKNGEIISSIFSDKKPNKPPTEISKILSILKTHPWVCQLSITLSKCEAVSQFQFKNQQKLSYQSEFTMDFGSKSLLIHGEYSLTASEKGMCSSMEEVVNSLAIVNSDEIANTDYLSVFRNVLNVMKSVGKETCEVYFDLEYDGDSDIYVAKSYSAVDDEFFSREISNIRFLKSKPKLN